MSFNTYFRLASYATIATAALALFVSGGVGVWLAALFAVVVVVGWNLEGTRWQFSERLALAAILISLPLFYLDWKLLTPYLQIEFLESGQRGTSEVTVLAHLILFLAGVKLLQRKADRDWFFLYMISFFIILLAAGLSTGPVFLFTLALYLLCALSTICAFEIQKARRTVKGAETRLLVSPDSTVFRKISPQRWRRRYRETRRLPFVSFGLLFLIITLALPFFLVAPRTASSALTRAGRGVAGVIGFSDSVTLGEIGRLKGSDEIVMHVRVEKGPAIGSRGLRWRGIALDQFTGAGWIKSAAARRSEQKTSDRGVFALGTAKDVRSLTAQEFFLEPIDTPVLFGAPRVVALQGRLPFVRMDSEGSIQTRPHEQERIIYRVYSDMSEPSVPGLRSDRMEYFVSSARYLELPANLNPQIASLAASVTSRAGATNGYDKAAVIEAYLRDTFDYSLDLKAGGADPLSDFLFRVRSGHCEYFSTAMAVMLRTQGVATRVVNGFLPGEYNAAAEAYTVRQSDAHSWVEVYFPQTNSWVTFDPTPPAGRESRVRTGLAARLSKYSEALELLWFQYVVGYDKQEQQSLASSFQNRLFQWRRSATTSWNRMNIGSTTPLVLLGGGLLLVLLAILVIRVRRHGWRPGLLAWSRRANREGSAVVFYEQLIRLLEKRGFKREPHQTPMEFAVAIGVNEASAITRAYNRVRFGAEQLSTSERKQIEALLATLERSGRKN